MRLKIEPDKNLEKRLLIERLWGKYDINGIRKLAKNLGIYVSPEIKKKINADEYLNENEVREVNEAISKVIEFNNIQSLLSRSPPDSKVSGYDLFPPFQGYFITIDRKWNVEMGNKWEESKTVLERIFAKRKPNYVGYKYYALLKALVQEYENKGNYEVPTMELIGKANGILNQNPYIRVWTTHFTDILGQFVFDTGSRSRSERSILPEMVPLFKLVIAEFEKSNSAELNAILSGKSPFPNIT